MICLVLSMETVNGLKLERALANSVSMHTTSKSSLAPLKVTLLIGMLWMHFWKNMSL